MLPASELGQSKHSLHFLMFRCCRSSQKIFFFYLTVPNYDPDNEEHFLFDDSPYKISKTISKTFKDKFRAIRCNDDLLEIPPSGAYIMSQQVCDECAFRKTSIRFIEQSNLDLILMKSGVQATKSCPFFMWWNKIDLGTHKLLATTVT